MVQVIVWRVSPDRRRQSTVGRICERGKFKPIVEGFGNLGVIRGSFLVNQQWRRMWQM